MSPERTNTPDATDAPATPSARDPEDSGAQITAPDGPVTPAATTGTGDAAPPDVTAAPGEAGASPTEAADDQNTPRTTDHMDATPTESDATGADSETKIDGTATGTPTPGADSLTAPTDLGDTVAAGEAEFPGASGLTAPNGHGTAGPRGAEDERDTIETPGEVTTTTSSESVASTEASTGSTGGATASGVGVGSEGESTDSTDEAAAAGRSGSVAVAERPHEGDAAGAGQSRGWWDPRGWPGWVLPVLVVGAVMAIPLYGMAGAPGQPMEEGFMLVFPERLLAGDMPHKDFLHLYGPGSLWLLAGFFKVLGTDLWVERLVGFLQLAGLVGGVTLAGCRWGRWPAIVGGTTAAVLIIPPTSLTALAWPGGVALALAAVLVAVRAVDPDVGLVGRTATGPARPAAGVDAGSGSSPESGDLAGGGGAESDPLAGDAEAGSVAAAGAGGPSDSADEPDEAGDVEQRRRRVLVGAGLLAGAALLFRPDLVVALALPLGALWLWGLDKAGRRQLATGLGLGVSPYLLHLVLSGPGNAITGMVIEPVFDLRPGRRLPFPPPWDDISSFLNRAVVFRNWRWPFPALEESQQVFIWVPILFAVCAALLAVGIQSYRARSPRGWLLLTLALLSVGILPQVVQRADTAHLAWVSALPFGILPAALTEWSRLRNGNVKVRAGMALLPLAILMVVIPHFTVRWYADYSGRTFGYRVDSWSIENRGRTFYYGRPDVAAAAQDLLADVEQLTEPGQRLIVGPGDFRRTPYSEAWLYFLLPQLEPGTRYIEMDPGIANADDSGLADELRDADVVILSTTYDNWVEPNTSTDYGSDEPNQVLEEEYCLHDRYGRGDFDPDRGFYELYLRC